jgi:hypothetical protein
MFECYAINHRMHANVFECYAANRRMHANMLECWAPNRRKNACLNTGQRTDSCMHELFVCRCWLYKILEFSASSVEWKNTLQTKPQTLLRLGYLRPVFLRARDRWRAGASGTDAVCELCSGCMTIPFLGSAHVTAYFDDDDDVSQLSATTTLLRRRHGRSVEFIHRCCWVSVSISSVYLLVLFSASSSICVFRYSSKFV